MALSHDSRALVEPVRTPARAMSFGALYDTVTLLSIPARQRGTQGGLVRERRPSVVVRIPSRGGRRAASNRLPARLPTRAHWPNHARRRAYRRSVLLRFGGLRNVRASGEIR